MGPFACLVGCGLDGTMPYPTSPSYGEVLLIVEAASEMALCPRIPRPERWLSCPSWRAVHACLYQGIRTLWLPTPPRPFHVVGAGEMSSVTPRRAEEGEREGVVPGRGLHIPPPRPRAKRVWMGRGCWAFGRLSRTVALLIDVLSHPGYYIFITPTGGITSKKIH